MSYENDRDVETLVAAFEDASVARGVWKHTEHLVVALYYVDRYGLEDGTRKIRDGLFNLLTEGFKIDLSKEMPYHETLTVFWMRTVAEFAAAKNGTTTAEKVRELIEMFDKDYPLRFYSREVLFSESARREFVEPDLVTIAPDSHQASLVGGILS